jgi:hypothetical protein
VRRWYLGAVGKHLGEHRDLVLVQPLPLRIRCDVPLLIGIQNSSQATILGRIAGLMGGGRGARLTGRADCLPGARGTRGSKGCQRAARRRGASPSGRRRGSTRAQKARKGSRRPPRGATRAAARGRADIATAISWVIAYSTTQRR